MVYTNLLRIFGPHKSFRIIPFFQRNMSSIRMNSGSVAPLSRVLRLETRSCETSAHVIKVRIHAHAIPKVRRSSSFAPTTPPKGEAVVINMIRDTGGATAPYMFSEGFTVDSP
jgi:hypothetical protein